MPLIKNHNRAYTISLLLLGFILVIATGEMLFIGSSPTIAGSSKWVFYFVAFVEGSFLMAIAVTLALRAWAPAAGRTATVALNLLLLLLFPFGTAVGIYGLWKADKTSPPADHINA